MDSTRAFDTPLPPESEHRLVRIFCFLRQHERKAKAARKSAELQKLSYAGPLTGSRQQQQQQQQRRDQRRPPPPQTRHQTVGEREDSMLEVDAGNESDCSSNKSNSGGDDDDDDDDRDPLKSAAAVADTARADRHRLLNELDALGHSHESLVDSDSTRSVRVGDNDTTDNAAKRRQQAENERRTHMAELSREVRELQKGILPATANDNIAAVANGTTATTGVLELAGSISSGDIASAMRAMGRPVNKAEVQWMIWEVDDDLDGCVDWHEFRGCYARTTIDKHGLEANQLFHLIEFLLCDTDESFTVSALELKAELKKLPGTSHLADKLLAASEDDTEQQLLQKFTLSEYLDIVFADLPSTSPLVGK